MSYNNRSDNFSVTSNHDGSRSFRGNHDYRFNQGSNRGSRGRSSGNSRGNRRPTYRHFKSSSARYGHLRGNEDTDGDISMSGDSRGRYSNIRSSRGSNRGRYSSKRPTANNFKSNFTPKDSWYKVMVPFGGELSQNELYGLITSNISGPFDPVKYMVDGKRAYFFVQGAAAGESLRTLSRRITKPDGHKLIFHVQSSPAPVDTSLSDAVLEKLKLRMSERYDPSTQLLNLNNLYGDEKLSAEGIKLPLNRMSTMSAVVKIILEHIPELVGLDLSDNRLTHLTHVAKMVKGTPNLVSLNLGHNQLQAVDELEKLKSWANISELVLEGNDFGSNFSNQQAYTRAVRKSFPKVLRLDGAELPPPITFDIETDIKLPPSQGSYFFNDDIKNLVVTFVKEYYSIYDSDRRRDLMPAYHENALMSVSVSKNPMFEKQYGVNAYLDGSRNLKKIGHFDQDKLAKRIQTGNLHVIAYLETLPQTTHDVNSFKVDVSLATPTMLCFVLHGVFKEADSRTDKLIRTFSRSFLTVPSGAGMVIINDMLTISNAGYEQTKNAFKSGAPTPSSSPVPSASSTSAAPSPAAPAPFLTPEQMQMVEKFVTDSGMNGSFSMKCLQENAWDYQRAGQVFTELHSHGKIPKEAFMKE